ncbi:MAG: hypothetical protein Q8K63_13450 [Acidimicrobiales bacterium]|nr:hypothetical protein [Acidimicrobiales bacterium]
MHGPRWDTWSDRAKREALAVALILTTTFGGWSTQHASAAVAAPTKTPASPAAPVIEKVDAPDDPVEAVFGFRDNLELVQLQLAFDADARDAFELEGACRDVVRNAPLFSAALGEIDDEIAQTLRNAATPTIALCASPLDAPARMESAAVDGFFRFWEAAFDVAA